MPRKGFDVLIDAVAGLGPRAARDRRRRPRPVAPAARGRRAASRSGCSSSAASPTPILPALYACADVFAMLCRDRWGGLEAEGFGIVFLEAAAGGVPAVAGRSGGSHEAVVDGETGFVVDEPGASTCGRRSPRCSPTTRCGRDGRGGAGRVVDEFSYDRLVARARAGGRAVSSPASDLSPERRYARRRARGGDRRRPARTPRAGDHRGRLGGERRVRGDGDPRRVGLDDIIGVAIGVALLLFFVALGAFVYAFGVGLARSTRGDNVAVANLFFLQGRRRGPCACSFLVMFLVCSR